ncbi:hypothetical protein HD597_000468 [Nonomuraea thailandensis]|uniref:RacP protein n=1 Tax=Nonomuraea thailandensis TaxID=1188745 RepID=A0A9X2GF00_9ACTN|nr:hypothetical protein [Nonomuraea thailandensis]MCP2353448.1 hypothetical protein [Nonomuraea thailandensis]
MPDRGLAANVCGEQVRLALLEARPAGLTARQLVAATGLSLYHVRKGILYIREVSAMANHTPLIWTYAGGYAFASSPDDWIAYECSRLRTELTRIGRFLSATVAPHAALTPEEEWIKLVLGQLNVVQTALTLVNKAGV